MALLRLPSVHGIIRRRLLVNFRVDAAVMARQLPTPFRPKLHRGRAIAGICLIRLEAIRPRGLPRWFGLDSENAAHRVAVCWEEPSGETRGGVFIPRRDTDSWLNHLAGGRLFPGEHGLAHFDVQDDGHTVDLSIRAQDSRMSVDLRGHEDTALPASSCFRSLEEASAFFEGGSLGYSATRDCCRLDGIRLHTERWEVRPFAVERVQSSFFADKQKFPDGSVVFDHALLMRNVPHRWHAEADLATA